MIDKFWQRPISELVNYGGTLLPIEEVERIARERMERHDENRAEYGSLEIQIKSDPYYKPIGEWKS